MEYLRRPLDKMAMKLYLAATELSKTPAGDEDNVVICPFSVTSIAAMLYTTADGHALAEIERLLKFSSLFEGRSDKKAVMLAFRETYRYIMKIHETERAGATDPDNRARHFRFRVWNRIFVQRDSNINQEFLASMEKNLQAEVEHLDVCGIDGSCGIEKFLKDKLAKEFDLSVPEGLLEAKNLGPRLVIANAASFRSAWRTSFETKSSFKAPFLMDNGKSKMVEYMTVTDSFPFYEDRTIGVKFLELPYHSNGAAMVLNMSTKKNMTLRQSFRDLPVEKFTELHMRKRMRLVQVTLPKFYFACTYRMRSLFEMIGIREVFKEDAEFSEIMGVDSSCRMSEGVHKANIHVDEEGTFVRNPEEVIEEQRRKTSVTSSSPVTVGASAGPPPRAPEAEEFFANHPFGFAVRHNKSSLFIFSGSVMNP